MTAAAAARSRKTSTWRLKEFTLASGLIAYQGAIAAIETSGSDAGKVKPGATSPSLVVIGVFSETVDATSAAKAVTVDLLREVELEWFVNGSSSDAVAATDVGKLCYVLDDQTVSILAGGKSVCGRIWAVDSTKGVAVEKMNAVAQTNAFAYAAIDATNDVTITVAQGGRRQITAAGNGKNVTLSTSGAVAGDVIHIWRPAIGATSGTNIVNGGAGAGTLMAQTANKKAGCTVAFDGTNWGLVASYQEP
jgi:hypothetical protein